MTFLRWHQSMQGAYESTAISVTGANPETGAEEKHTSVEMASVDAEKYF